MPGTDGSVPFTGDIHRIVVYEGLIGSSPTRVFDVDFVNGEYTAADKMLDSAGGAVVTIHGLS